MFDNPRYITRGADDTLAPALQNLLWYLVDCMGVEHKDCLQGFHLYEQNEIQMVRHTQEQPPYEKTHALNGFAPVTATVFVIDDKTHSTMMLAEEY